MKISFKKVNQASVSPVKELSLIIFLCLVGLAMHLGANAQDSETVTASVTPTHVALSISVGGTVNYGVLGLGTSAFTLEGGLNQPQQVQNDGNQVQDFYFSGQDSTPGGWVLGDTSDGEQYVHAVSIDTGSSWANLTTGNTKIIDSLSSEGGSNQQDFDLMLTMPSGTTATEEQSVDVSILATEAGETP